MKATDSDSGIKEASAAADAKGQMGLRLSINPTYDSRKTGQRFWVDSFVGDRLISTKRISDPFIRTTIKVSLLHALGSFFRFGNVKVEVCVTGDNSVMEDVLELDANYIGHGSTRRVEWNTSIETALGEFSEAPSVPNGNDSSSASSSPKSAAVTPTKGTN